MKKIIKYFSVYLTAVLLLVSCICFPSFCASAASSFTFAPGTALQSPDYYDTDLGLQSTGDYVGDLFLWGLVDNGVQLTLPAGDYIVYGNPYASSGLDITPLQVAVVSIGDNDPSVSLYLFGEVFSVPTSGSYSIICQSFSAPIITVADDSAPLYQSAWDLLVKYVYGEGVELTPDQTLTLTILSTIAVLAVVLIPFIIVFIPIWLIFRR